MKFVEYLGQDLLRLQGLQHFKTFMIRKYAERAVMNTQLWTLRNQKKMLLLIHYCHVIAFLAQGLEIYIFFFFFFFFFLIIIFIDGIFLPCS